MPPFRSLATSAAHTSVNANIDEERFAPSVSFPKKSLSASRTNSLTRMQLSRYMPTFLAPKSLSEKSHVLGSSRGNEAQIFRRHDGVHEDQSLVTSAATSF